MDNSKIIFKGNHLEIGKQIGDLYLKWDKKNLYIPKYAEEHFNKQLNTYEKYYPEYLDYLKGISFSMSINLDSVLKSFLTGFLPFAHNKKKCSFFAFKSNNNVFIGRNYDWLPSSETISKVIEYNFSDNTNSYTAISDMGTWEPNVKVEKNDFVLLFEDAWNKNGLFICLNGTPESGSQLGLATPHVIQLIAEKCSTTKEAINLIGNLPLVSPIIFCLADKGGNFAIVEKRLDDFRVTESKIFALATNHYQHPDLYTLNKNIFNYVPFHSTFARYEYLKINILEGKINDLEDVKNIVNKPPVMQNWRKDNTVTCWSTALELNNGKQLVTLAPLTKN